MLEAEEVMCVGDAGSGTDKYTKLASEPAGRTLCAGGASFDSSSCQCPQVSCSGCLPHGQQVLRVCLCDREKLVFIGTCSVTSEGLSRATVMD